MGAYVTANDLVSNLHPMFRKAYIERKAAALGVGTDAGGLGEVLESVLSDVYDFAHDVRDELEQN